jgi:hypothetical protein
LCGCVRKGEGFLIPQAEEGTFACSQVNAGYCSYAIDFMVVLFMSLSPTHLLSFLRVKTVHVLFIFAIPDP